MEAPKTNWPDVVKRAIASVNALAIIGGALYLIVINRGDQVDRFLAVCLAVMGVAATVLPNPLKRSSSSGDGAPPALMMIAFLVLGATTLAQTSGCGAGARGVQADTIAGTATVFAEVDASLVRMRARHLDAIVERARAECAYGCSEERAAFYRDALADEEAKWEPLMTCRDPVPPALRAWLAAVATPSASDVDLLEHAAGYVDTYDGLSRCINAALPDGESFRMPELPSGVADLARRYAALRSQSNKARGGGEPGVKSPAAGGGR